MAKLIFYFLFQHFEDFVVRHFISRAHDIMVACNAYMEGDKMRCLVKGAVQEGGESCSGQSKTSLARNMKVAALNFTGTGAVYSGGIIPMMTKARDQTVSVIYNSLLAERMKTIVKEFIRIGATCCEKFLD
jgi:hypothetical protein